MFKLVIADDEGKTTVVPLVREEISIGRKEGNTIRLTERNVSRKHARLRRANGAFLIEDLSSFNGVKVNGRKIGGELELNAGDQITIGDYQLALQVEATDTSATMPETNAPSMGSDAVTAMIAAPQMGQGTPARLVMLSPPAPGQEFALNRASMKLGRAEDLDIWVNHRSISREHAEFVLEGDRYRVLDMGSANGMRINGVETKSHQLSSGDVVEIGQVKLRYVEPGEGFVFDEGRTMQMDAISDLGSAAPNRMPMYIGGAIIGVALLGGLAVLMGGGGDPEPTVTPIATVIPSPPLVGGPGVTIGGTVSGSAIPPTAAVAGAPPTVDVLAAVAGCRTALNSGDFEAALTQANLALSVAPSDAGALACRDSVTNQRAESDAFATGLAALHNGDLQGAYVAFESLPEGSSYRNRTEFTQAMRDFAEQSLRSAENLVDEDPTEASRLAQMVLTMSVIESSARARADAVVRRARPRVASSGGAHRGGTGPVRTTPGGGGSTGSGGTPGGGGGAVASSGTPPPTGGGSGGGSSTPAAPETSSRYDSARACAIAGDHGCVITQLRGHSTTAREFEMLIVSMRATSGYERDVESNMRTYLSRFPAGRQAGAYRQYLVAHSGG
jgi:pSer/pThr/pTyr-binding forkhead associated (FHA) protein